MKSELTAIAVTISNYEPVTLLVHSKDLSEAETAFQSCGTHGVEVKPTDMDDLEIWMRDIVPAYVFAKNCHLRAFMASTSFQPMGRTVFFGQLYAPR